MVRFVVKTVNAAYMCGFFTYYMLQHEWSVLQALTFQGLLLLAVYCLIALLEEQIPRLASLTFLLQNISFPLATFISLLSWILLIPVDRDGVATFKNHFFHTTNSLVPVLSLLIYPQTWRPRLCFVPLIYGLGYLTMAGAMQANGSPALYPFLDFIHSPGIAAAIIVVSCILLPLLHLGFCGLNSLVVKSGVHGSPPRSKGNKDR